MVCAHCVPWHWLCSDRAGASYFRLVRPLCTVNKLGGSGGMLPLENFKIRHSEIASEAIFGPKMLLESPRL